MDTLTDHPKPPPRRRDPAQPTDIAERVIALQRRNAARARDRVLPSPRPASSASRPTSHQPSISPRISAANASTRKPQASSNAVLARPEADPDDFSRRLQISGSPRAQQQSRQPQSGRLYNPDADPIPIRPPTPLAMLPAPAPHRDAPAHQRLFDHRKDDPVRFSVLARPSGGNPVVSKPSGDLVSASSTFTLSSGTTDNSSASSALFEGRPPREDPANNAFAIQLKKLYRTISTLESKILNEDSDENVDEGRVLLQGRGREVTEEELEQQKWMRVIADHKQLVDMMHNLMQISLSPSVPASLRVIPTKYNIIIRLWTHGFHKLLEALRRASFNSPLALEHLQDFIYFAYTFYTGLLEEPTLRTFRAGWLEALGDLARYRMAVAAMVTSSHLSGSALTTDAVSKAAEATTEETGSKKSKSQISVKSSSVRQAARIDDSPTPSVGIVAARMMEIGPEKERWRCIAKEWYFQGLAETPGTGKLHHHLGLLSREVDCEELRAVYHFVRSMTTLHPFSTSRESVLPIWSSAAQTRRSQPDASAPELFTLLHGMLFTNIQLDDFASTLARFLERLEIEGAQEREWIMMAVINIGAIMEYGRQGGVLRKVGGMGAGRDGAGITPVRMVARRNPIIHHEVDREDRSMDIDDESPVAAACQAATLPDADSTPDLPPMFKFAMQLAFSMLSFVLRHPTRKASQFSRSSLNPYVTIMLTFLATVCKHTPTLSVLERTMPWGDLAQFFSNIPKSILAVQGLLDPVLGGERWSMLTSGCAPPLPEDWCMRGMEWVGRKVFERGYWRSGEDRRAEMEILEFEESVQLTDGIIEDEDEDRGEGQSVTAKRWTRLARCAVALANVVDGFSWREGTRQWTVEGTLAAKVERWQEEDRREREEEERRRRGRSRIDDVMDIDTEEEVGETSEESEDDGEDSTEIKALKARRQYLRSLLNSAQDSSPPSPTKPRLTPRRPRKAQSAPTLTIVPGYTILVLDTNILLSSLSVIASIVESLRWTVVIPVPVVMELDGLSTNTSQLGEAAREAVSYVTSHVRSHGTSLKVQTSKGNYLTSLSVRTEQVDFSDKESWERSMDDLILKAAVWQDEHWVDRSILLKGSASPASTIGAVRVVLLSFDRNLRLKARARQLPAADEKDLAGILAFVT
ncbi:hypothetical protein EDC04DRAFT_2868129 [Pisolithus marmoratus]|nr:hypothetical protein EDC04DRAFT_2868129 [Pisolithus marmoratus]